ncbi:cytochrome b [Asaia prunellae]|uniref:cytochrome b n=1 Tax=Asaia prunellae TaxID=610245 RepID=UPI000AADA4BD|nr:cytochrome b/b6 domain-containing protein [Asaia prunellae]
MTTSSERYGAVAMILHWIMALGILFMLGLGLVMVHGSLDPGIMYRLFQLHKSIGITLLAVALLRVVWRFLHHPPAFPASMSLGEIRLAKLGHALLYMELFFMPLSGWALVSSSVFAIPTVLYGIVPWPDLPFLSISQTGSRSKMLLPCCMPMALMPSLQWWVCI